MELGPDHKLIRIVGKPNFSDQFKTIIKLDITWISCMPGFKSDHGS